MGDEMSELKIVCISDLHGMLPTVPDCDILLIGGDICPCRFGSDYMSNNQTATEQAFWLRDTFGPWLAKQPVKHTVSVWGNHDWIGEVAPERAPSLPWHMLCDQGTELLGLKIYASPWQSIFFNWAFNATEEFMEKKWSAIPDDTEILVLHGPPHGFGDLAPVYKGIRDQMEHTGSPSLTKRIMELKKLKLVVCGHIHRARGVYLISNTPVVNASVVNEKYQLVNDPIKFTFDLDKKTTNWLTVDNVQCLTNEVTWGQTCD